MSCSEGNAAIIVAYENCGEEEEEDDRIESREEGSSRLRYRSAFLQEGECSQLIEGQCVLALHDASSSHLFFDAIVEKVYQFLQLLLYHAIPNRFSLSSFLQKGLFWHDFL